MRSRILKSLFITLILLCLLSIFLHFNRPAPEADSNNDIASVKVGKAYGQATIGGPFKLVDQNGIVRTQADYNGKFMVVYFGYSFCPDICPAALYNMTQAFNELSEKELSQFAPLFITIDPERDSVENLKTYMQNFHPAIIALTGTKEELAPAIKAYRVYAKKAKPDGTSTEYLLDHSSIVYLMDRQGRFITSFNHQTDPETIIRTLRAVL